MGISDRAVAGINTGQPPRISTRQQRFWLIDAAGNIEAVPPTPEGYTLDVVIADANPATSRMLYLTKYDAKNDEPPPPDCWSDDGIKPATAEGGPYDMMGARFEGTCAQCHYSAWGSEINPNTNKKGKRCKEGKKLAVVLADRTDRIFQLRIPPATLRLFKSYVAELMAKKYEGQIIDVSHVITRVSFDPSVQGVLNFRPVGFAHDRGIDLAPMYEANHFAQFIGCEGTPMEQLAAPLRVALPKQTPAAPATDEVGPRQSRRERRGERVDDSAQTGDFGRAAAHTGDVDYRDLPFDDGV